MPQFEMDEELSIEHRKMLVNAVTQGVMMGHSPVPLEDVFAWAKNTLTEYTVLGMVMAGCMAIAKGKNGEMAFFMTKKGREYFDDMNVRMEIPPAFKNVFDFDMDGGMNDETDERER